MLRNELLRRVAALPAGADVIIQIGDDHLDIADVVVWGDGSNGAVRCHPYDLRDLVADTELPDAVRERLAPAVEWLLEVTPPCGDCGHPQHAHGECLYCVAVKPG